MALELGERNLGVGGAGADARREVEGCFVRSADEGAGLAVAGGARPHAVDVDELGGAIGPRCAPVVARALRDEAAAPVVGGELVSSVKPLVSLPIEDLFWPASVWFTAAT